MRDVPRNDVLERLRFENPWWEEPHQIDTRRRDAPRRKYLDRLMPLLSPDAPNRAVVVLGPRRVGKTWMLHHAIHELLESGIDPRSIGYISIDSPLYNQLRLEALAKMLAESAGKTNGEMPAYVFFDEIQYLKEWEHDLKRL